MDNLVVTDTRPREIQKRQLAAWTLGLAPDVVIFGFELGGEGNG